MNEDNEAEKPERKKIEIRDFADEQKPEEQIDLTSDEQVLDDETIDEVIEDDNSNEAEASPDDSNEKDDDVELREDEQPLEDDLSSDSTEAQDENAVESKEVKTSNGVKSLTDDPSTTEVESDESDSPLASNSDEEIEPVEDLEDKELEQAVDDIVREEADDVLVLDDAIKEPEEPEPNIVKKMAHTIKNGFSWWWNHTFLRNTSLIIVFLALLATAFIPVSRYAVLNAFGVRVESRMRIVDSETSLPLENIRVSLQDSELKTNENGEVHFTDLKLGSSDLLIARRGYAETRETIVLGWGSNPLGDKRITATGLQYKFELRDWISNVAITDASAISGEYTARADEAGIITLTLSEEAQEDEEITVRANGYRDEVFIASDLSLQDENPVLMVNDRKHVFVSNRDSRYDLFTIDLDGNNETLLLEGTGKERDIPQLSAHPAQQVWALIGSHEGETNSDGYILDGLYVIETQSGNIERVARSERLQVVGWSGDYLVYSQIIEGTSQGNPERSKLFSYNFITGERKELAAANYFNDVELVSDIVYYAVSGFAVPESYARLFQVYVDGEQKVQVLDKQVYSIFRTGVNELLYSAANQEWFDHDLSDEPKETDRRTSVPDNYNYVYSPSENTVSWVRVRDGQGVLQYAVLEDTDREEAQEAAVDAGIREPLYWLGDKAIVYRVVKSGETADYLVSLDERPGGGDKISKITNITIQTFNGY